MSLKPKAKTEVDEAMIDGLWSDDPLRQLESAAKFRKILSRETSRAVIVVDVVESGVVPRFVEFLKKEDNSKLQKDAACVLNYISEENAEVLIDHGAVQIFIHLLAGATDDVYLKIMATDALGDVALDSTQGRDYVLRCGALSPLLAQLHEDNDLSMLRIAAWTLSNFCQPLVPFHQMKPALSALQRVLHIDDEDFLSDACWALHFLSDGSKENIQSFIVAGLVPRLVQLLGYNTPSVIDPAIGIIMDLTYGDNEQTKIVIDHGVVPLLPKLLTEDYVIYNNIKRYACRTISNITAGTEEQIQSVIDANLIPMLVNLAQDADFDIKKTVVLAIYYATFRGSHDQIKYLVEQGCIKSLCDLLVYPDLTIISLCLVGLENILSVGEAERNIGDGNYYSQLIEDAEGLEKIKKLQHHISNEICEKALRILKTYWEEDDDEQTQKPHWSVNSK